MNRGGQSRAVPPGRAIVTHDKARKSAVRRRMAQTGETYSAARRGVPNPGTTSPQADYPDTDAERQYAGEALAAGVPADEVEAQLAAFRAQDAALAARESADQAEREALAAEERADLAHDAADLARESGDRLKWQRARERSEQAQDEAEQARQRADALEEAALEAEELAELTDDAANPTRRRRVPGWFTRPGPGRMMSVPAFPLAAPPPPPPPPPAPSAPPAPPLPPWAPGLRSRPWGTPPTDSDDRP